MRADIFRNVSYTLSNSLNTWVVRNLGSCDCIFSHSQISTNFHLEDMIDTFTAGSEMDALAVFAQHMMENHKKHVL